MTTEGRSQGRMSQHSGSNDFQERTIIMDSLSAHFEKDHDLIGSQDPYFILTLCGDEVKTRTIKSGGVDPVWEPEEGYRLHDRGEHPELLVHAMNKNRLLKDSSLGEGKIAMADLGSGGTHSVPLYNKKGNRIGEFKFRAKEEQGAMDRNIPEAVPSEEPRLERHTDVVPVAPLPVLPPQGQRVGVVPSAIRQGPSGQTGMMRSGSIEPLAGNDEKTAHLHLGDVYLKGQGPTSRQLGGPINQQTQQMPMDNNRGVPMGAGAGIIAGSAGFPPRDQHAPMDVQHISEQGMPDGHTTGPTQGVPSIISGTPHSNESHSRGGYSGPSQGVVGGGDMGGIVQPTGPSRGFIDYPPPQGNDGGLTGTGQPRDPSQLRGTNEPVGQSGMSNEPRGAPQGIGSTGDVSHLREDPISTESHNFKSGGPQGVGSSGGILGVGHSSDPSQSRDINDPMRQSDMPTESRNFSSSSAQAGSSGGVTGLGQNQSGHQYRDPTHSRDATATSASQVVDGGLAEGQTETIRKVTTTEDTDKGESSEHRYKGAGGPIQDFETGDDHWEKSLAASAEARRQSQLVERASRETHTKLLAAQEATRSFDKARREHMAIEEQIAGLDLEAKRAQFERASASYDQLSRTVSGKVRDATTAQEAADLLRLAVNEKGEALDAEVQETKLHQSRLATLEEELARLRAEHDNANSAHQRLVADMEPKREKHNSLKEHFHIIRSELMDLQRKRAILEMKEAELEGQLSTHNAEFEAVGSDLDDHDAMREKLMSSVKEAEVERRQKEEEAALVTATLAEHRQRIGVLKEDTEAALASAEELESEAREKERVAHMAEEAVGQTQAAMGRATQDLTTAESAAKPFHEKIRKETTTMDKQHEVVEELHRKLGMAKSEVDRAQARKEELWEKAKYYGEKADEAADSHYLRANQEFKTVLPAMSGVDPYRMTSQGSTTTRVLENAGERI